ncbi:MAG TPA: hypothetical protein VG297_22970 [Bryobacteraceae bacterium]|nr:hypothetical protein [Bryobacteraceae bacterium]
MGIARSLGLQADLKTPSVRKLFYIAIEVIDVNDNVTGGQSFKPGSEPRLHSCLREVVAENIDT